LSFFGGILASYVLIRTVSGQMSNKPTISFNGEIEVKQDIPGRLRIYCHKLRDDALSDALTVQLCRIDGIKQVSVSRVTGSILVLYDAKKIESHLLQAALVKLLGVETQSDLGGQSIIMKEITLTNQALNYAILDKTRGIIDVKTALPIIFIGLAIKELIRTGTLGTPAPITLLYWAYTSFGLSGNRL
jgi:hypothetical protein